MGRCGREDKEERIWNLKIAWALASYRRPKVETLKNFPFFRVYVDPAEADEYRRQNPGAEIIECPPGVQGNFCRVRNYILKEELKQNDAVVIVDDDLQAIMRFSVDPVSGKKYVRFMTADEVIQEVIKLTILAKEWGAMLWGMNSVPDQRAYRVDTPFRTIAYVGSPFHCHLKGTELYYDEDLVLKEDYDLTLQHIAKYRIVLRVDYLCYRTRQREQSGGCAMMRNYEREMEKLELLRKKWGSDIVRYDPLAQAAWARGKRDKLLYDINPKIKVPIAGV